MTSRIGFWQAWIVIWTVWDLGWAVFDFTWDALFGIWMGFVVLACWVAILVVSRNRIRRLRREARWVRDWHEALR